MSNQLRLLFFIVVISGALCTVQDYVIMSQCAHNKAIHLAAEGTVSVTDISQTQNITIVGLPDYINNDFKITLYAKETQRYLCFNENWKLVGMRELQETCYFNETIVHGYFVFRSVIDLQRRVGFTHRGKAIGPKKNVTDACYLFTKIHAEQFFHQHTQFFAPSKPRASAAAPTATTAPASRSNNRPRNKTHGGSSRPNGGRNSGQSSNHSRAGTGTVGPQAANSTSQQHHQVRHHHNDPNVVARRHQHEHKQKRRQRNRIRPSTATAATAAASASPALSPATPAMNAAKPTAAATSALAATKTMHPTATAQTAFRTSAASTRPAQKIAPTPLATSRTTVTSPNTTMATAKATSTATATSTAPVATTTASRKRKGRRRKGDKQHKKHQQRLQQQQQPPVTTANAKDPQHRLAFRAQSTAATYLPSSSTPGEDAESSSVADALSSSSSEFSFLGADWSTSIDPSAPTADRVAFAGPSATTLDADWTSLDFATSVASSAWPTVDPTLATVDSNMLSASTGDGLLFASPSQTSILAEGLNRGTAGLFSLSPDARPTATYDAARAWSEVTTFFDDLETSEQLLAPTPMLATALNTAVGHLPEENLTGEPEAAPTSTDVDSSSSGGGASYETTGGLNDTEATVETTTGDDEMTTWIDDADAGAAWTEPESSSVSTRGDVAATSAALLEREPESSTQLGPATTIFATATTGAGESSSSSTTGSDYSMTEYVFSTRSSNIHNKNRRHRNQSHKNHQSRQQVLANNSGSSSSSSTSRDRVAHVTNGKGVFSPKAGRSKGHGKTTTKASGTHATSATSTAAASEDPLELLFGYRRKPHAPLANSSNTNTERRVGLQKNISNNHHNNSLFDYSGANGSGSGDGISSSFPLEEIMATPTTATSTAATTRRHLRKSTQRLLATPFHQLTYVRNHAGDIDIDNIDNISVYPDLDEDAALEDAAAGDDVLGHSHSQGPIQGSAGGGGVTNSRMTIVSGYLPTSATATLPESIRIAKIKINNERKRMLRQRSAYIGSKA